MNSIPKGCPRCGGDLFRITEPEAALTFCLGCGLETLATDADDDEAGLSKPLTRVVETIA